MKIAAIMARKNKPFETVTSDRPISSAVEIMHRKSIGSVGVVDDEGHLLGLISQPELLEAFAQYGCAALSRSVGAAAHGPALTCYANDHADDILRDMALANCRHAIVIDSHGDVAGLVSLSDLTAAHFTDAQPAAGLFREIAQAGFMTL